MNGKPSFNNLSTWRRLQCNSSATSCFVINVVIYSSTFHALRVNSITLCTASFKLRSYAADSENKTYLAASMSDFFGLMTPITLARSH